MTSPHLTIAEHDVPTGDATSIRAHAVGTVHWLAEARTRIVVPVYQRQYRWDIGGCEQLLADIRAVSGEADGERTSHFIGSILSAASEGAGDAEAAPRELVLIDGQQRITTLMLLVAALHHTVRHDPTGPGDAALAVELERVLVDPADPRRTKLRPHSAWAGVFERVVLGGPTTPDDPGESRFDDNYAFFRSQVPASEVASVWAGLQRLEHVAITLEAGANAQQIFESLNSTGEPLRDHELIHNYVLMGLTHAEQTEIERAYWLPIERNTGDSIAGFWRHYLVALTGREIDVQSGRGVYDAFRHRFPRLDLATLHSAAAEWRAHSETYRVLLDPALEPDPAVSAQLAWTNTFGRGMYPLVMRMHRALRDGTTSRDDVIASLEHLQALLLRRSVVGLPTTRLVARLCRALDGGRDELERAVSRITPSDERTRIALKFGDLPHAAYVLGRLAGATDPAGLDVEHVLPLAPADSWTGDGERRWVEYSDDEQNAFRASAQSLGNLALLEEPLAERAFGLSFPDKRAVYARSGVAHTRGLAEVDGWSTAAVSARTAALTAEVLRLWQRPATAEIDDDGLTPILDAQHRRGWPRGWDREFDYVEYRGEHWEVYDVKYLFDRVFKRLWADSRDDVVSYSERRGGPIFSSPAWNGQWHELGESHHLYLGWDSHYMLTAVQGVLEESGLAAQVFVKYSYIGAAM